MAKYFKILIALLLLYALISAAFAWYTTAPYRPSHQANVERVGFKIEEVQVKTTDGITLRGWYSEASDNAPVVALFHGHRSTRMDSVPLARILLLSGYNVLLMDFRGCGASDGSTQSLGAKEALDVDATVKFLHEKRNYSWRRIGVVAIGTGASATILAKNTVRDIGAAILMAPYATLRGNLDNSCRSMAGMGVDGVGALFLEFVKLRIGQNTASIRPLDTIQQLAPCPLFLVGAGLDKDAPTADIQQLFNKAKEPKELYIIAGVARERLIDLNGSDLRKKLTDFLDMYLR